jgi:CRISPR/Cas system Type II protein with McrA/HNH and RuvC-like nuclease domain
MKDKILELKLKNPTWGYKKIAKQLKCAYSTVRYHLCPQAKEQLRIRQTKNRKNLNNILKRKKDTFQFIDNNHKVGSFKTRNGRAPSLFSANELKEKLLNKPICYLTGRNIDLLNSKSFHLDHIIPISKGGDNSLKNCGLTCKEANMAKAALSLPEFLNLCAEILRYHGFSVSTGIAPDGF